MGCDLCQISQAQYAGTTCHHVGTECQHEGTECQHEGTTSMYNMRAQHEGTCNIHAQREGTSQTELEVNRSGTGRMPHPVGGAMGMTSSIIACECVRVYL